MAKTEGRVKVPYYRTDGYVYKEQVRLGGVPIIGPYIGNANPIGTYLADAARKKSEGEITTAINFDNSALNLTADTHLMMLLMGGWEPQIQSLLQAVGGALFDKAGFFSQEALKIGQSSLGPRIVGEMFVIGGLKSEKKFPRVSDLLTLFEGGEDRARTQRQRRMDEIIPVGLGAATCTAGEGMLSLIETTKTVAASPDSQIALQTAQVVGESLGGLAGFISGRLGNAIIERLRGGEELPKIVKDYGPMITGLMGVMGGKIFAEWFFQTTQAPISALQEYWPIPLVAGVVGGIGVKAIMQNAHEHEQDAIEEELRRIDQTGRKPLLLSMANSINTLRRAKVWGERTQEFTEDETKRKEGVHKAIREWDPQVTQAVDRYDNRSPDTGHFIRNLAPSTLAELTEKLFMLDLVGQFCPVATLKNDGMTENTIAMNVIPPPDVLFALLNRRGLAEVEGDRKMGTGTWSYIKQMATEYPIAALSAFSPTLALIMIGQGLDSKGGLGASDDAKHFALAGMNFGARADFVDMVSATLSKWGTIGDSWRARMLDNAKNLGSAYKKEIPIEGLEFIFKEPAYLRLAALGGIVSEKSQKSKTFSADINMLNAEIARLSRIPNRKKNEDKLLTAAQAQLNTAKNNENQAGTKGLIGDVGGVILSVMEKNPLIGYLVLADITTAIKFFSSVELFPSLGNFEHGARRDIIDGLRLLRQDVVGKILKKYMPQGQTSLVSFYNDPERAGDFYTALTLCQETCTDRRRDGVVMYDTVDTLMKTYGQSLSPIFTLDNLEIDPSTGETTNAIVIAERESPKARKNSGRIGEVNDKPNPALIDMVWLASGHTESPVHVKLAEVMRRQILPSILGDFMLKISSGGNGGNYDLEVMKNAQAFIPYALKTVHPKELNSIAENLVGILKGYEASAAIQFGGVMGEHSELNQNYLRLITVIDVTTAILDLRRNDLGNIQKEMKDVLSSIENKFGTILALKSGQVRELLKNLGLGK